MIQLVDTHCHIYSNTYKLDADETIAKAVEGGVGRMICVGTDLKDSQQAITFVQTRQNCWASAGIHPHEAKKYLHNPRAKEKFEKLLNENKVVAIGECGLDYFYHHSTEFTSPKEAQKEILRLQIELALKHNVPLMFHIRNAFADFWAIFDEYRSAGQKLRGVVHSFSAGQPELDEALSRGLYIGLNGIMTFTKDETQLAAARAVPLTKLVLETDAPFLTPTPYRGTINEPKHVRRIAEFLSELRGENLEALAAATTHNAEQLFGLAKDTI